MAGTESPIFTRCYDLLRWLIPLTVKFPRQQRFVLAEATQQCALRLHERLIEAAHTSAPVRNQRGAAPDAASGDPALASRLTALTQADIELDKLRHYLRLCHDLELINAGQYEHGATQVAEIGRLLGGWQKSLTAA